MINARLLRELTLSQLPRPEMDAQPLVEGAKTPRRVHPGIHVQAFRQFVEHVVPDFPIQATARRALVFAEAGRIRRPGDAWMRGDLVSKTEATPGC